MNDIEYVTQLLEDKGVTVVTRKKHSYIMYQGIESEYLYVLKEGVVKVSSILRNGREFNITYVCEPDFVSLLEEEQIDGVSALFNVRIESEEASFYRVPRKVFWEWIDQDLKLFRIVDKFYQKRLMMILEALQKMTVNGKKGAVCTCLYNFIDYFGIQKKEGILIDFPVTNEDIAGFCGISTRTSVNRILRELREEKVIDVVEHRILVCDRYALQNYIN
ncbi:Crp/Fnr family transcriptional regulator [Lactococcus garvieae]|uniref:Transcription regulator n=1 Tax=Lactococcus garvieae DCC43 TaxID=1231377 RepID=K2PT88_9LACT|nr:Crp/Fnr family transcriptional regulator [Lactococcus garvieae]EKF50701.1 transcription regulator [Lactococcus garvieae DCC43]